MTHTISLTKALRHWSLFALLSIVIFSVACGDDDSPEEPEEPQQITFEGTGNINPNNFPAGMGLDLSAGDTGRVAQLDEVTDLEWDILFITYRTTAGGRPGIILFGDSRNSAAATQAVNVTDGLGAGMGSEGFTNFTMATTAQQAALSADDEFLFDPETDVDERGLADIDVLTSAYQDLIIGDRIVNLDEADQPVYLVRDRSGNLYKFMMVSRANGGAATLRWERFNDSDIE